MIKVTNLKLWRSEAVVNSDYDSARVTLDMPLGTWRLLKKFIKDSGYFHLEDISDVDASEAIAICEKYGIKGDYE